ncbi:putative transcription factor & chromatin remodeling ARID family [Helianthus anomalus]
MAYVNSLVENTLESRDVIQKKAILIAQDEEDVIENDMIIKSCLDWFDLILLYEQLVGHELFYDASMEEIINWFIPCFLGIYKENSMPPTLLNGKPANVVKLYQVVKDHGGFKKMMKDSVWNKITFQCDFDCNEDQEVKIAYVRYISLIEW